MSKIKANIALFYKYTGKQPGFQEQVENGVTKIIGTEIQDFHLLDLTANKLLFKYVTINAGVKNLLDVTRLTSTNTSGGAHSSSGPVLKSYGRSFFLGFLFNWN